MVLNLKSTPMVESMLPDQLLSTYRRSKELLPTPWLPAIIILNPLSQSLSIIILQHQDSPASGPKLRMNQRKRCVNCQYDGDGMLAQFMTLIIQMLSSLRLTNTTVLGKDEQKKLSLILNYLIDNPEAAEFLYPVDWEQLGLNDYPILIKHPMHLLKVQERLKAREYRTVEEVLDHIQLIWDNCKEYNQSGPFYTLADKMERNFKKMIKNYLPNIQIIVPSKNPPSLPQPTTQTQVQRSKMPPPRSAPVEEIVSEEEPEEIPHSEKNRFSQRMKQITQQELAQIVGLLQENCPEAFKDIGGNRSQIVIDSIDQITFKKLNQRIDDFLEGEKAPSKKHKN